MNCPNLIKFDDIDKQTSVKPDFSRREADLAPGLLDFEKYATLCTMYAKTLEIRMVANPHFIDPSWEGVGG